jgi:hypothetical protein
VDISPVGDQREISVGTLLAIVVGIALVAFVVWAMAFAGASGLPSAPAPAPTVAATNPSQPPAIPTPMLPR